MYKETNVGIKPYSSRMINNKDNRAKNLTQHAEDAIFSLF